MEELPVARQTSVTLLDDIDGSRAAETVVFGIDGASYQIDLSKRNAASLRKALTEFVENGRRVTNGAPLKKRVQRRTLPVGPTPAVIRAWAEQQGITVAHRGRIPGDVIAKFKASQQG
jgi:hypothetical protein